MTSPRILLIDDHAMFRSGIGMVLNTGFPGAEIIEADALEAALHTSVPIDVILLDIKLNGLSGLEGIALLKRKWPLVPILVLSAQDDMETMRLALARGAIGFVSKAETVEKIVEAIQHAVSGQPIATPASSDTARGLTPRQCEVLDLLHQGMPTKTIARQLTLSENTVRRHVQAILLYFQVSTRAEAVFAAHRQGMVG